MDTAEKIEPGTVRVASMGRASQWAKTTNEFGKVPRIVAQARGFVNLSLVGFDHSAQWMRAFFEGNSIEGRCRHGHFVDFFWVSSSGNASGTFDRALLHSFGSSG